MFFPYSRYIIISCITYLNKISIFFAVYKSGTRLLSVSNNHFVNLSLIVMISQYFCFSVCTNSSASLSFMCNGQFLC